MSSWERDREPWRGIAEAPLLELTFRPQPLVSTSTLWSLGVLLALAVALGSPYLEGLVPGVSEDAFRRWAWLAIALVLLAIAHGTRNLVRRGPVAPLQAYADYLVLPLAAGSARAARVAYTDVLSLELLGNSAEQAKLVIGTRQSLLVYPLVLMNEPGLVAELRHVVRERLAAQPGGDEHLRQMDHREAFGRAARARPARATWAIIGLIVAAYLVQSLSGSFEEPLGALRFGANAPLLVAEGEYWRLFAANFLHAGFLHLFLNGIAVLILGLTLERLVGSARYLLVYLGAALGGSTASTLVAQAPLSVGASTAVFGLLGAMAVIQLRFGYALPTGFRQPARWWATILILNGALTVLVPQIDVAAHAGGFVAGALLAALLVRGREVIETGSATPGVRALAVLASLGFGLALAMAARASLEPNDEARIRVLVEGSDDPVWLNQIAWFTAIDRGSSPVELEHARAAAARAVELAPEEPAIADTLATTYHRLGQSERAARIELDIVRKVPDDPVYRSQLARFLAAHAKARGALRLGPDSSARSARVARAAGAKRARIELEGTFGSGSELWWVERDGDELAGYAVLRLGATEERTLEVDGLPEDAELELVLVDTLVCSLRMGGGAPEGNTERAACAPGSVDFRYERLHPEIRSLP